LLVGIKNGTILRKIKTKSVKTKVRHPIIWLSEIIGYKIEIQALKNAKY
jgi:hypothetical protein